MKKRETYRSKAEKLYKAQQRRIKDLRKRGYLVQDLAPLPKKIGKKEYERLQKSLTLDNLYNSPKNYYFDKEKQRLVSAKKGREIERSKASKKGWIKRKIKEQQPDTPNWYETVILGVFAQIDDLTTPMNKDTADMLKDMINEQIATDGRNAVAQRLFDAEQNAKFLIERIMPPSGRTVDVVALAQFAELIKGSPLDDYEKTMVEDAIPDVGYWNGIDEYLEEEYYY